MKIFEKINIDNIVLTIFILLMASASTITSNDAIVVVFFVVTILFFFYRKQKFDKYFFVILFIWSIINLFSYMVNNTENFKVETLIGVSIRIFFPYFMVKVIGNRFFDKLVTYIYYLAIISLVLYPIDAMFKGLYDGFAPILNFITLDEQKGRNGWYIYIYMHNAWAFMGIPLRWLYRNSGFMWEPGGYSLMLIFSLAYNMNRNKFKFDQKNIVFTIALITTFSTSGILALLLIVMAYTIYIGKRLYLLYLILIPIVLIGSWKIYQLDFISGKINQYYETIDYHNTHFTGIERVNRFGVMKYNLEQAFAWPLGNGALESKYLKDKYGVIYRGPNTFAGILYKWGFLGLILFPFFLYKFYKSLGSNNIILILFMLAMSMVFFSNPTETKPLYMSIVFYTLLYNQSTKRRTSLLYYEK